MASKVSLGCTSLWMALMIVMVAAAAEVSHNDNVHLLRIFIVKPIMTMNPSRELSVRQSPPKAPKHKVCATCSCDPKTKTINCAAIQLFNLFTIDEWQMLNTTESPVDTVSFENNGIAEITPFPTLSIRHLSFRHNRIERIAKQTFKNLTLLEHLDLSFNQLTSNALVPEVFEGKYAPETYEPLKYLKTLNLGNNHLHTLDPDLFEHFPNLENLILESNAFMVMDHLSTQAISSISSLKVHYTCVNCHSCINNSFSFHFDEKVPRFKLYGIENVARAYFPCATSVTNIEYNG